MAWQQLRLNINSHYYLQITDLLENMGALAISLADANDQAIYEPPPNTTPLWKETILTALFAETQDLSLLLQILHTLGFVDTNITYLADQAWERVCMDQFEPMRFGQHLWICPSWHKVILPEATIIHLDPGLAFGTGSHPTTKLCLEWIATHSMNNKIVMDYGCGSGILGIAALKCGAQHLYAVDIDPQACEATQENMQRNQIPTAQYWSGSPADLPSLSSIDIILANILALPLINLAPFFTRLLKPGGQLILSGILLTQQTQVLEAYCANFTFASPTVADDWVRLMGMKK